MAAGDRGPKRAEIAGLTLRQIQITEPNPSKQRVGCAEFSWCHALVDNSSGLTPHLIGCKHVEVSVTGERVKVTHLARGALLVIAFFSLDGPPEGLFDGGAGGRLTQRATSPFQELLIDLYRGAFTHVYT